MSSNISFLLSLAFVLSMFAYAGDLCHMQMVYAQLDSLAISAGKLISRNWSINEDVIKLVSNDNAHIVSLNKESYILGEGDAFLFQIWKEYKSLAFSSETKQICINRSVVLGYKG